MLSRGLPQVNFQFENSAGYEELLRLIEEYLPPELTAEQEVEQRRLKEASQSSKTNGFHVSTHM